MNENLESNDLAYNGRDFVVSTLKSAFGIIPFAGPAAQELLETIIPKQRFDRVVVFVKKLADEFEKLQDEVEELQARMYNPEYSSLFYKACIYSADSINEEKIEYIKNIFIKGLTSTDENIVRNESLLSLLNRLNDVELIFLRIYYLIKWDIQKAKEYQHETGYNTLHSAIHNGMTQEEIDKEVAKDIYISNLRNYGLLDIEYDNKGKAKYKCSKIGDLLMRTII